MSDNTLQNISGFKAEKIVRKYTMEEFWASLYWDTTDENDDYDGYLHICSNINGTEIKIPIADIVHQASKAQNKERND